jgi:hypothetical protein
MSWRKAAVRPVDVSIDDDLDIVPLAFLVDNDIVAAACLKHLGNGRQAAGVLISSC